MVKESSKTHAPESNPETKLDQETPADKNSDSSAKRVAVDRPGFDLGGSTGETSTGSGLGLGKDAAENRDDRRLPRRTGKRP
ncbi:hypothetical protein WNZ14_08495 [Hoeflea sp. AS60]|uniref:hypothetical protein n=1 Tax=Hoeflea sp. AS60 TaxID=3135780 RepID=UPI003171C222